MNLYFLHPIVVKHLIRIKCINFASDFLLVSQLIYEFTNLAAQVSNILLTILAVLQAGPVWILICHQPDPVAARVHKGGWRRPYS